MTPFLPTGRLAGVAVAAALAVVMATGCGDDPVKVPGGKLAEMAPADVPLYAEMTGEFSGKDRGQLEELFDEATGEDGSAGDFTEGFVTDLLGEVPGWRSLDYDEVQPWIGNRAALYSLDGDTEDAMIIVTTDPAAADATADKAEEAGAKTTHRMIGHQLVVGDEEAVDAAVDPGSTRPSLIDDPDIEEVLSTPEVRDSAALMLIDPRTIIDAELDFDNNPRTLISNPAGALPAAAPAQRRGPFGDLEGIFEKLPYDLNRPSLLTVGIGDGQIAVEAMTPLRKEAVHPDAEADAEAVEKIPPSAFAGFSSNQQSKLFIDVFRKQLRRELEKELRPAIRQVGRPRALRFLRAEVGADIISVLNGFTGEATVYGTGTAENPIGIATLPTKSPPKDILNFTRWTVARPYTAAGKATLLPAPGPGMRALKLTGIGAPELSIAVVASQGYVSLVIAEAGTPLTQALRELGAGLRGAPADRGDYTSLLPEGVPLIGFGEAEPFKDELAGEAPMRYRKDLGEALGRLRLAIGDEVTEESETLHYVFSLADDGEDADDADDADDDDD